MINSRKIEDLHPIVQRLCLKFIAQCKDQLKCDVKITSTYRDNEQQAKLYAQGRTKPGRVVTNAKPGQSWHNWRMAFDFAPLEPNGSIDWNDTEMFLKCRKIGESIGLEGLSFELAHLQYRGGLKLADMAQGYSLDKLPKRLA